MTATRNSIPAVTHETRRDHRGGRSSSPLSPVDRHRPPFPADYPLPDCDLARTQRQADREQAWATFDRYLTATILVLSGVGGGIVIAAQLWMGF